MRIVPGLVAILMIGSARADILNVRDYGAEGGGKILDTAAIQKAVDACAEAGGGVVRFPPGVYLSQPITIGGSHITFELDAGATLLATTNQADFMKTRGDWLKARSNNDFNAFIHGKGLTDVAFTGGGTVDGNGAAWWGEAEKAHHRVPAVTLPRPNLIELEHCRNVRMENLTLQNSPKFHFGEDECEDVVISNVTILSPEHSVNTGGIDANNCKNVFITGCRMDTGDDNVAINASHKVPGREFACEGITVTGCVFLHGHGVSIGSETIAGVHNVTVQNCVFKNTENGIRIKSQRGTGGLVENIIYKDIRMTNVDPAISFTCYYMDNSATNPVQNTKGQRVRAQPISEGTPVFRDIYISNLAATCERSAGMIMGLPESPISDVFLENVEIRAATGMTIRNARNIRFKNVRVTAADGRPFIVENAEVKGLN